MDQELRDWCEDHGENPREEELYSRCTRVSNCCGAEMTGVWLDEEICPDCQQHCEIILSED